MNKKITSLVLATSFLAMAMTMPSCPGQQAMQQQIDAGAAKNAEFAKSIQVLNTQVKTMTEDMTQVKTLLSQVSNTVLAQKTAMEQMDVALKAATAPKPGKKHK